MESSKLDTGAGAKSGGSEMAHAFARRPVLGQGRLAHPRGMGELGVIVIAENIVERLRRGRMWVDVRMRVDQGNSADLGIEIARQSVANHVCSRSSLAPAETRASARR